ncbi:peptidoglycan editing factor PgeF [Chelatococcus sp. XZ-Ab1]|uniref:peptidoglycan editing factor PgeF n=1 Tax=Chelatococcus sp. XZ-Ab1 TaxID=3034027 RepID=UPI0023E431B6|nr:peptidoglycan editing factor PgeF [Chelatococcus sp. XZ-Ab1]
MNAPDRAFADSATAEAIEAEALAALGGIRHAFFTRRGGVSGGIYGSLNGGTGSRDDAAAVRENRRRMAARLGLPAESLLGLHQVHSPDVVTVETPWPADARPKADGCVTRVAGIGLAISTADCGPLLFADPEARVIGAAHSGWRGAFSGIVEAVVVAMEALGAERGRMTAVLGPTISASAYEVGPEFVAQFRAADPACGRFFTPAQRADHAMFDLPGFIGARMAAAGVGRFIDLGLCTYGDEERFYSYRRATHRGEADYGRLIAAITLTS